MGRILIISDQAITEAQQAKARQMMGNFPVSVLGLNTLQVTEARHADPTFGSDGTVREIEGYTLQLQILIGSNSDNSNHSARGYIMLSKAQCPGSLKEYAHYMEGMDLTTKVVNPRHAFSRMTDGTLTTESGRKWYGMRPLGGTFVVLVGDTTPIMVRGTNRFRTPIEKCVLIGTPEFQKTAGEKEIAATTVLGGWDDILGNEPAGSDDF